MWLTSNHMFVTYIYMHIFIYIYIHIYYYVLLLVFVYLMFLGFECALGGILWS